MKDAISFSFSVRTPSICCGSHALCGCKVQERKDSMLLLISRRRLTVQNSGDAALSCCRRWKMRLVAIDPDLALHTRKTEEGMMSDHAMLPNFHTFYNTFVNLCGWWAFITWGELVRVMDVSGFSDVRRHNYSNRSPYQIQLPQIQPRLHLIWSPNELLVWALAKP